MNRNTNSKKKLSATKKLIASASALAAATTLVAGLVIPASAQETDSAFLTLNATTEVSTSQPSFVLTDVSDVVKATIPSVVSITSRAVYNYYKQPQSFYGNGDMNDFFKYFFEDSSGFPGYYQEVPGGSQEWEIIEETPEDIETEEAEEEVDAEESEAAEEIDEHANEIDYGIGSGTIISKNADELLILTSYHVVENCSSLYVTFCNDVDIDGYIKSVDEDKDIAVVAVPLTDIDEETMEAIKICPIATESPEVGDGIIIIGNALGYGISVTSGIISAVDREITVEGKTLEVIQTDAAINSGNSGGCMLNSRGEIVGISEAKVKLSYVEGMCYAIPVVPNTDLLDKLINTEGKFSKDPVNNGGFLGIQGKDVTAKDSEYYGMPQGVFVVDTIPGGGAADADVKKSDIITAIDGVEVASMEELSAEVVSHFPGDTVTITLSRMTEGEYIVKDVDVTLTDRIS